MEAGGRGDGMVDVFAEWMENAPVGRCGIPEEEAAGCSELFKVRWQESFVAEGGRRLICHFIAPDAESVRMALRCANIAVEAVWSGTVHTRAASGGVHSFNGAFLPPLGAEESRALAIARPHGEAPGQFELTRAIVSSDGTRVIGVCDAAEGGAPLMPRALDETRQRQVWRCRRFAARAGVTAIQAGSSVLVWPAAELRPDTYPQGPEAAPSA
jgi:Protein of unknown function (DUF4242)